MKRTALSRGLRFGLALALAGCESFAPPPVVLGPLAPIALPTGQQVTPTLPPGSTFGPLKPVLPHAPGLEVGGAVTEALSPDGKTLAVLTTGFNRWRDPKTGQRDPRLQSEYVFLFDVGAGAPMRRQVLELPNTWAGIAFGPDGKSLYVSGGVDDSVHTFAFDGTLWAETGQPIPLGHPAGVGAQIKPVAAGLAVSADGRRIAVANMYNDSLSVVDLATRRAVANIDLRPGKSGGAHGAPGGNYPYWVAIRGNDTAYVSSVRDREVVVVDLAALRVVGRIELPGNPNKMLLDRGQRRLFVAMDNADAVAILDTSRNAVAATVGTVAPDGVLEHAKGYGGAAPNSLALSADESTLYVTNGGTNAIAVIDLRGRTPEVEGLIPTGWYPQHVVVGGPHSDMLYVVNSKSVPGANPGNCEGGPRGCPKTSPVKFQYNQYVLQLSRSGFQAMPIPADARVLAALTKQVEANNALQLAPGSGDAATLSFLRERVKHVIYIIRENRTYDQLLGDLGRGNGDPALTEFGAAVTPNVHALAKSLVTLDNFFDPAEVSGNGWPWSTGGRESDFGVKMVPPNYAGRGGAYEWEGENRGVGMGVLGAARRATNPEMPDDDDFLPGMGNVAAPDGPNGARQRGYLWSAALRAGKTVRNYGFFVESLNARDREPFAHRVKQAMAVDPELRAHRRVLPGLRPGAARDVARARVGAGVPGIRGTRGPAGVEPRALRRRPHGGLQDGDGRRRHAGAAGGGERLRRGKAPRGAREEPLRAGHAGLHRRGRLPGRARPRRCPPGAGVHRGPVREARRRRLDTLLDRQRPAHDRRPARPRPPEPLHRDAAADDRRVRYGRAALGLHGGGTGAPRVDGVAAAEGGRLRRCTPYPRRCVLGEGHGRHGLRAGRRDRRRALQPDPLGGAHGRPAVPGAQGRARARRMKPAAA